MLKPQRVEIIMFKNQESRIILVSYTLSKKIGEFLLFISKKFKEFFYLFNKRMAKNFYNVFKEFRKFFSKYLSVLVYQ
jgi:hypothetical protein